ncbi:HAMP domain-containing histidine kinase [Gammaproteobacteria bacterium]|nr:HAMP domain-containing histidine kinase [Gammaproteobacteria bacterium]
MEKADLEGKISALKKENEQLRKRLGFITDVMDCIPQQIWVSCEGDLVYCSKSMRKVLEKLDVKIDQNIYAQLIQKGSRATAEMIRRNDEQAAKSTVPLLFEENAVSYERGKKIEKVFLSYKQLFENDYYPGVLTLGMSFDITMRKAAEINLLNNISALKLADQTKRTFVQNFRHDLKEPLSNIIGASDCLKSITLDSDSAVWVDLIQQSAVRLLEYINKLTSGLTKTKEPLPIVIQDVDLKVEVEAIEKSFRLAKKLHDIAFSITFSDPFPKYIKTDLVRIQRIISNLISNALKYTQEGIVDVTISMSRYDESQLLEVCVSDTGIGIPQSSQHFIFSPLYRVANHLDKDGSGLGLSIVKEFVDELNGQITVKSIEGEGSTFVLVLPIEGKGLVWEMSEDSEH